MDYGVQAPLPHAFGVCAEASRQPSADSFGAEGNDDSWDVAISGDGNVVAFSSLATNLAAGTPPSQLNLFLHDRTSGSTTRVDLPAGLGLTRLPALSADGTVLAFIASGDLTGNGDYLDDDVVTVSLATSQLKRVTNNLGSRLSTVSLAMSDDGTRIVWMRDNRDNPESFGPATGGAWLTDLVAGTSTCINCISGAEPSSFIEGVSISGDGTLAAFAGYDSYGISDDTNQRSDVIGYEVATGKLRVLSRATDGTQGNNGSYWPALSADGRVLAFGSDATNLVGSDTNGQTDIFATQVRRSPSTEIAGLDPLVASVPFDLTVTLRGGSGQVDTAAAAPVTLEAVSGPPGAAIQGITTAVPSSGVAVFPGIHLDAAGTWTLRATAAGYAANESAPIDVIPEDRRDPWDPAGCRATPLK